MSESPKKRKYSPLNGSSSTGRGGSGGKGIGNDMGPEPGAGKGKGIMPIPGGIGTPAITPGMPGKGSSGVRSDTSDAPLTLALAAMAAETEEEEEEEEEEEHAAAAAPADGSDELEEEGTADDVGWDGEKTKGGLGVPAIEEEVGTGDMATRGCAAENRGPPACIA